MSFRQVRNPQAKNSVDTMAMALVSVLIGAVCGMLAASGWLRVVMIEILNLKSRDINQRCAHDQSRTRPHEELTAPFAIEFLELQRRFPLFSLGAY